MKLAPFAVGPGANPSGIRIYSFIYYGTSTIAYILRFYGNPNSFLVTRANC